MCFLGTLTETECICDQGYSFDGNDCAKNPCHEGCDLCDTETDFRDCYACTAGYHDIAPTVSSGTQYKYCVPECPTGYSTGPCQFNSSTELILRWDFNFPIIEYTNSGEGGFTFTVNAGISPAKNRGVYFDGASDGFIVMNGLVLSHSFMMMTWCNNMNGSSNISMMFHKAGNAVVYAAGNQLNFQIFS
jgi:hypothetical protein